VNGSILIRGVRGLPGKSSLSKTSPRLAEFLKSQSPGAFLHAFEQDARALVEQAGLRCVWLHIGEGEAGFDAKWIRQMLLNLLTNAIAASSNRGIITIRSVLRAPKWTVSVEDQGVGVPADKREQIFERFVRLAPSEDATEQHTGLGLAICRSVVELHGGRIFATAPDAGPGLRVIFELPAADSPAEKPVDDEPGVRKSARAELTPVSR